MSATHEAEPSLSGRGLMPPFRVLRDFLAPADADRLLAHAAASEAAFAATRVGRAERRRVAPAIRVSSSTRDLADSGPLLRAKLRAAAAELAAALGMPPFVTSAVELELVAHGDGAFYKRHVDTQVQSDRKHVRVLSGVYYLHRRPKRFAGGVLRLYAIGDPDGFQDVEPLHNALLVFPAWAPHEVMPVSCPSGAFIDSRFAVNCWLYARRPGAASEYLAT